MSPRILRCLSGITVIAGCVLTSGGSFAAPIQKPGNGKKPANFVIVTEGIVGGFVAAHVRRKILIYESRGQFEVLVMTHASRRAERVYRRGSLKKKAADALFAQWKKQGLGKLPVESPVGIEDVYKKDTSLAVRSGALFWRNGGPGGCSRGKSKVQPDEKQRREFVKFVSVVQKVAEKQATTKSDRKTFLAADRMLHAAARTLGKSRKR